MLSAKFHTIGCKLNQTETAAAAANLAIAGIASEDDSPPELLFVNTCAVTNRAAAKSRQLIARLGREHPGAVIVAAGCLAQLEPEMLAAMPGVKYVLGTEDRHGAVWWGGMNGSTVIKTDGLGAGGVNAEVAVDDRRARPFLKIQDGCDQFCAFCIIPHLRGLPRSVPEDMVLERAADLARTGAEEIVLTGVRIGAWGNDLPGRPNLARLIANLGSLPGNYRIRLGSLEPWELNEEIIELILTHPRVCRHLHVPLQHTVPSIVEAMGRPSPQHALELLRGLHRNDPFTGVGVDLIAGFPGESEGDFNQLMADLDSLPLTYIHAFSFSPRPGTAAAHLKPMVPAHVICERVNRLAKMGHQKKAVFMTRQLGRYLDVIPDRRSAGKQWVQAVASNYTHIVVPSDQVITGKTAKVSLEFDPLIGFTGWPL